MSITICPPVVPVTTVAPSVRAGGGEVGIEFLAPISPFKDELSLAPPPSEPIALGGDRMTGGLVGQLFGVG